MAHLASSASELPLSLFVALDAHQPIRQVFASKGWCFINLECSSSCFSVPQQSPQTGKHVFHRHLRSVPGCDSVAEAQPLLPRVLHSKRQAPRLNFPQPVCLLREVCCKTPKLRGLLTSHQLTWKCTDPCRKTTFLLERTFLHFHVSWWKGKCKLRAAY